jgi:hypothetical protein
VGRLDRRACVRTVEVSLECQKGTDVPSGTGEEVQEVLRTRRSWRSLGSDEEAAAEARRFDTTPEGEMDRSSCHDGTLSCAGEGESLNAGMPGDAERVAGVDGNDAAASGQLSGRKPRRRTQNRPIAWVLSLLSLAFLKESRHRSSRLSRASRK